DYTKMLYDTSKDVVLISDVHNRRSWLVPKLSLMLHMAHAWAAENGLSTFPNSDPMPFAEPYDDASVVIRALEGQGDLIVCGQGNDSFKLRTLLLGLSINLLASTNCKAKSTTGTLYGFELMDLIMEPGRGCLMKELKIKTSQTWLALANLADAVIICSELGEAITPAPNGSRGNAKCGILPRGQDYFAAHLSCLDRLRSRAGKQPVTLNKPSQVPLSTKILWKVSGNPFELCKHECHSVDTCWNKPNILQSLDHENPFWFMHSTQKPSSSAGLQGLDVKGAVVFGRDSEERVNRNAFVRVGWWIYVTFV
ncbi:hypothetical protein BDY21DRAFT_295039, partial [Lineolata rhizophorae]